MGVHPHVQRCVGGIREPALGPVELHRRHAEIEQNAVDFRCPQTGFSDRTGNAVVAGAHQHHPVAERCQSLARDSQRIGIAVQPDQPQPGQLAQETLGMPAGPQRGVNENGSGAVAVLPSQSGHQEFDAAVEQDRDVAVIIRHLST